MLLSVHASIVIISSSCSFIIDSNAMVMRTLKEAVVVGLLSTALNCDQI